MSVTFGVGPPCYVRLMNAPHRKDRLYVSCTCEGQPASASRPVAVAWRVSPPENQPGIPALSLCEPVEEISVRMLARCLKTKPFEVVADLLKLGVLVNADQRLDLKTAFKLLRYRGYRIERA
jgi:hypothetical protein